MILADSSAWVEFLRWTGSPTNLRMRELLVDPGQVAVTDAVAMEVLSGARDTAHRDRLRRLLWRCRFAPTEGPGDFEDAAEIYRACRQRGHTVRNQIDCLIASVAIRAELPILHVDGDFDAIARHTPLTIA